jgi:16S rRNA (adenine1518-N6/adenine1519-N6)-dimethyltransferase
MVQPKKKLGQHFLTDQNIAEKIVRSLSGQTKCILEIGPGTGVLTRHLIKTDIPDLFLIELDIESVEYLKENYPALHSRVLHANVLKYDLSQLFEAHFSIIGNFPYNISTQILFKVLEYRTQVVEVVGMFQKEVAERIAEPPGSKKYGILSVLLQAYYEIEYLFTVNENVFYPPPNVKSAVIRLKRNDREKLDCDESQFFALVKTAFNQRRKTLRNSLKAFNFDRNEEIAYMITKRAEQLSVADFEFLCQKIKKK